MPLEEPLGEVWHDPCKTTEAKKYQVLDFRIRCSTKHSEKWGEGRGYTINDMPVKAKRSTFNYTLPITLNKAVQQAANVTDLAPEGPAGGRNANITRYQLKESSIRNVIHRNDGQEEGCDERDGWCLSHTADDLRDIMSSMIKQVIRAKRPGKTSLCNTDAALAYGQPGLESNHGVGQIPVHGE
ncbi:unnamed protein product [Coregonus sp. 'balchen']|nr:unnamed protein product [Coregonus sp. 'balchen']